MHRFTKLYPELDIRIDSSDKAVNLEDDSTDVAVRYGPYHEGDPSMLFREQLVAVYSPDLLAPGQAALTLADLPNFPLLYESSTEDWLKLLNENKALKGKYNFSRGFSHWGLLAQAAVAGQGIALVAYGIAYLDIQKGTLKRINCRSAPFPNGYRFLVNPHKQGMTKISRFHKWLVDEMQHMRQTLDESK
jgi:LysR family glycine cleavage system transcriptional activator